MLIRNIEDTIVDLILENKLKTYYDIGASLTKKTLELFNILLINGITIHAFEPHPVAYDDLKTMFPTLVNIHNIGIGNKNESKTLYSTDDVCLSSFSKEFITKKTGKKIFDETKCVIRRLDDFISEHKLDPPDIIKVDTEDWEDRVFDSIPLHIKPIILAEYHSKHVRLRVEDILRYKYEQNIFYNNQKNTFNKFVRYFVYTPNDKEYML